MNIGQKIFRYDSVTSTNVILRELALEGFEPGTVVVSTIQTKGCGRLERTWDSPKGGLWLSVLLKTEGVLSGEKFGLIPLMTSSAVATALANTAGFAVRVKWPNDVLINGKKACGILGEIIKVDEKQMAIVGIGLNVNNNVKEGYEFSAVSTSVSEELGKDADLLELEAAILCELANGNDLLNTGKYDNILKEWRDRSDTLGKKVRITTATEEIEGLAKDIDENGSLVLDRDGQAVTVMAGDCTHLE
jgi:BirA family biotin operon repressor/biotin-[acetyl-CoA-carboxylase] ligase